MRRISVWIAVILVTVIAIGTALGVEWNRGDSKRAESLAEKETLSLEGTVKSAKLTDTNTCRLTLDAGKAGVVVITVYEAGEGMLMLPGMDVKAEITPALPEGPKNPGAFDYKRYLKSEGVYLTGTCGQTDLGVTGLNSNPIRGFLVHKAAQYRQRFFSSLSSIVGEDAAGLFTGMLFGDKSALSSETYESFQKNGTAHILSVSGLHVGIVYAAVMGVFGKRKHSKAAALTAAAALFLMAVLASFSVSVVRAVIMIYLKITADLLRRSYDLLSAACVTASIFLIKNPMTLYSTGFILSFSAVISLSVVGKGLERMVKCDHPVWLIFRPIIAIQIGMAPLTAYFFNYFSVAAFISNIPVIFLSGLMIPCGFILSFMIIIGGGSDPLTVLMCQGCSKLAEMLVFFNDFTGAYGAFAFSATSPGLFLMAGYYTICLMVFSELRVIYPLTPKAVICIAVIMTMLFSLTVISEKMRPEVVFVDVGQGDCIHIRTPEGKNYLVDGGGSLFSDFDVGKETLKPYLLKNGVDQLDGVFITHMDADHYKGISGLNEVFQIDRIFIYDGYKASAEELYDLLKLDREETAVSWLAAGMKVTIGKGVYMDIIYPCTGNNLGFNEDDENDNADFNENCLVMKLHYFDTDILLTGDISAKEEIEMSGKCGCDIVKVPHHGSRYSNSEDFVKNLGAKAAVIEVGKNNFGHPDKSVIERYEESGIMVYRTDKSGAVSVKINRTGWKISVQK